MCDYIYQAISQLQPFTFQNQTVIILCAFSINLNGLYPFLEWHLIYDEKKKTLTFPLLTKKNNLHVCGCLYWKKQIFAFSEYNSIETKYKKIIVDEIINHKKSKNMTIHSKVIHFFNTFPEFLFLQNKNREIIETPCIAYTLKQQKTFEFYSLFGEKKTDGLYGNYYYFTDYETVVLNGSYIIRYALFLGKTKVIMGLFPIEIFNLNKSEYENKMDCLVYNTQKWNLHYDSLFQGKIQVCVDIELHPTWVVINNSSFTVLNY
jgi:hypothetical protein